MAFTICHFLNITSLSMPRPSSETLHFNDAKEEYLIYFLKEVNELLGTDVGTYRNRYRIRHNTELVEIQKDTLDRIDNNLSLLTSI